MSIARALTRRYKVGQQPEDVPTMPTRSSTLKRLDKPIDRSQISLPIELISSTNVMAYEAPDLVNTRLHSPHSPLSASPSSAGSLRSYDDSASSSSSMTSPDISREPSPTAAEPSKQASYFAQATSKMLPPSAPATPQTATFQPPHPRQENMPPMLPSHLPATPQSITFQVQQDAAAPSVPSRAPSHTKKTHHALARKRSMRLSNEPDDLSLPAMIPSVPAPLSPAKPRSPNLDLPIQSNATLAASTSESKHAEHPFGAELAQVKEVAEEFGVSDVRIWDEEEQFLLDNGFGRYGVEDYMSEIQPLFSKVFGTTDAVPYSPTSWL